MTLLSLLLGLLVAGLAFSSCTDKLNEVCKTDADCSGHERCVWAGNDGLIWDQCNGVGRCTSNPCAGTASYGPPPAPPQCSCTTRTLAKTVECSYDFYSEPIYWSGDWSNPCDPFPGADAGDAGADASDGEVGADASSDAASD